MSSRLRQPPPRRHAVAPPERRELRGAPSSEGAEARHVLAQRVDAARSTDVERASPPRSLDVEDALACAFIAITSVAAYVLLRQRALQQDGPGLLQGLLYDDPRYWMHVGILPVARVLALVCPADDPSLPLSLVSALGAALGLAATYLFVRREGAARRGALLATTVGALCAALVFHATLIEVHALHFGAVALALLATTYLPALPRVAACAVLVCVPVLLFFTHRTGVLLLPGWIALAVRQREWGSGADSRRRRVMRLALPTLCLGVGAVLAIVGAAALRGQSVFQAAGQDAGLLERFGGGPSWSYLLAEWIVPLGALLPLCAIACVAACRERLSGDAPGWLSCALLLAPSWMFFIVWGERTQGGYALGTLPVLLWIASRLRWRRIASPLLALAALALQLVLLRTSIDRFDGDPAFHREARARFESIHAALGGSGVVLTLDPCLEPTHMFSADVREFAFAEELALQVSRGRQPAEIAQRLMAPLEDFARTHAGSVAVHLGMPKELDGTFGPYVAELRARCRERFTTVEVAHERYPVLRIDGVAKPR